MNSDLWQKINSFLIDDLGSDFKFSDRLARENSWSKEYTLRCIDEYKKFLFLCAEAGHKVTPSVAVDQVWHLHLCYTRSYWNDLCQDILGFPLHHGPTKGGKEENEKFNSWYEKSLDSYQKFFQTTPPEDIWPPSEVRFAPQNIKNIDVNKHFVVSKKFTLLATVATVSAFSLAGCAAVLAKTEDFSFGWVIFIAVIVIILAKALGGGGGKNGGNGGGCSSGHSCGSSCGGGCGGGD